MKKLKREYVIYIAIICIIWIIIVFKYCFIPNDEIKGESVPLTDAKFIDVREKINNVSEDTVVNFYYRLVNIGSHELKIGYINPDCTCTECYATDSIVMPGDTTMIVMKFDTKHKLGFHKLNSVVKLNTPIALYKISAIVEVVKKDFATE